MLNADQFTVINIVMIACVLITFFSVYVPQKVNRRYKMTAVFSLSVCALMMAAVAHFKGIMAANNSMLAIWIPLTFVVFWVFSKHKGGRYLVTYFISLLSITSINGLGFIVVDTCFGWRPIAHVLIRCTLMLLAAWLMWRFVKKPFAKALTSVSKGWSLMAVVTGLFYLAFVVFFAYPKPITERPKEYGFAVLLILTIYCAVVLVIYTILNLSQEIEKGLAEAQRQNEQRINSMRLAQMEQQYKNMMNTLEQTRIIRHDLAHHFRMISEYCSSRQYEKIEAYLEELNFRNVMEEVKVYCRNGTANVILSYYAWLSETEDITYSCEADLPAKILCNEMDLSVLLGNALENAVEGCRKVCKERELHIRLRYEKKKLIFDIRNSFDGILREKNGLLQSTKEQEQHGFGMRSIQRVVDKYDGYLRYYTEEQTFILQIVLILEEL